MEDDFLEAMFSSSNHEFQTTIDSIHRLFPAEKIDSKALAVPTYDLRKSSVGRLQPIDNSESQAQDEEILRILDTPKVIQTDLIEGATLYAHHRKSELELSERRNMYFRAAAEAFTKGNSASATDLAQKGRKATAEMREAGFAAMLKIFEKRNVHLNKHREIDLHGMHVNEGIRILRVAIRHGKTKNQTSLRVITGRGIRSRLRHAVEQYLKQNGLKFTIHPAEFRVLLS